MKKTVIGLLACSAVLVVAGAVAAQIKGEELARDKEWEDFLATAAIVKERKIEDVRAVTHPWRLTLEKDGLSHDAAWKNPEGRMGGFLESWKWEIAAYRVDRLLGLNMVPVTVERRYQGNRGSLQLWTESKMSYNTMLTDKSIKPPGGLPRVLWDRAIQLQRAFDNFIANEDRHAHNILITEDWRMILIDHSRSFRTSPKFTDRLIYHAKRREGDWSVKSLARDFWENLKRVDYDLLKKAVEGYLTDAEIKACLVRRDLQVADVEAKIKALGEVQVLY